VGGDIHNTKKKKKNKHPTDRKTQNQNNKKNPPTQTKEKTNNPTKKNTKKTNPPPGGDPPKIQTKSAKKHKAFVFLCPHVYIWAGFLLLLLSKNQQPQQQPSQIRITTHHTPNPQTLFFPGIAFPCGYISGGVVVLGWGKDTKWRGITNRSNQKKTKQSYTKKTRAPRKGVVLGENKHALEHHTQQTKGGGSNTRWGLC